MITLVGIIVGFLFFCFLIFVSLIVFAPQGYEDEDGFHYAHPVPDRGPIVTWPDPKANTNKEVKTPVPYD